jgi:hypothetical protein
MSGFKGSLALLRKDEFFVMQKVLPDRMVDLSALDCYGAKSDDGRILYF